MSKDKNINTIDTESGISKLICTCPRPKMVPAGKLVHLVPTKVQMCKNDNTTRERTNEGNRNYRYTLKVIDDVAGFSDIRISPRMLTDHYPQSYVDSLKDVQKHYTL